VTLPGETVTLVISLLASVTVTPPVGAGVPNVTGNGADWLGPMVRFVGRMMAPGAVTVTVAVVSGMLGSALAWMVVEPPPTPVTGTFTLVAPAAKFTVGGTVATLGLSELRLTFRPPAGADADRVRAMFLVAVPEMDTLVGE
jgi:hypothetical protein